jgi:uncharacterized protein involved in exopolysaccharide biosynthesis
VEIQQQLYATLTQAYEQARIDEVRNTPVFTIIDPPEGSEESVDSTLPLRALAALALGFIFALGIAISRDYAEKQRQNATSEFTEFRHLRQTMFRRLFRRGM